MYSLTRERSLKSLSKDTLDTLRCLTNIGGSGMREVLDGLTHYYYNSFGNYCSYLPKEASVIMCKYKSEIIGWSLILPRRVRYRNGMGSSKRNGHGCYLYIRQDHRRKGIGSKLLDKVRSKYTTVHVHPWNAESRKFFKNHKVKPQTNAFYTV